MEKLSIEQENRTLRDQNFELQSKARAAETQSKKVIAENHEKDKQIRTLTDQHSELLRLLESEEHLSSSLQTEISELRTTMEDIKTKYTALLSTARTHEELAGKAIKEGQLHVEEIRILRAESEHLKQHNVELKMKTQVEIEAMQEQLRVRKEKQYQLLEKLQVVEEAKKRAEDQVAGMDEQLRSFNARTVELEHQYNQEKQWKMNFEQTNKQLQVENNNIFSMNKELTSKIEKSEQERLRMEAEARDNGEQLREMAEKVFQLLERLKLSELGKAKAMEALKKKESDFMNLEKKNSRLLKDMTEEGRLRAKAELDIKVLQEQVRAIKKINTELTAKNKEEGNKNAKLIEEKAATEEKISTLESRLSFLLNKVQMDEETRLLQVEDRKKLESNLQQMNEKCNELAMKLQDMGESNRVMAQAMRIKQDEYNALSIKHDRLAKDFQVYQEDFHRDQEMNESSLIENPDQQPQTSSQLSSAADDIDNVRLNEGRGRFYIEAKSMAGGSGTLLYLRGRKATHRDWLRKQHINEFIKKSQRTARFRELVIEKIGQLCGLYMVEEEERLQHEEEIQRLKDINEMMQKKLDYSQQLLSVEEDAKRRMLLRYIHAVKEHAQLHASLPSSSNSGSQTIGILQLPESNITDEEVHALAALLRNNTSIEQVNLRNNSITDEGARALANVLSGRSNLRQVDLRGNKISKAAIRILAEALERSERVRHVYVHVGGKIEALGAALKGQGAADSSAAIDGLDGSSSQEINEEMKNTTAIETVCIVDVRDNEPSSSSISMPSELLSLDISNQAFSASLAASSSSRAHTSFQPRDIVAPPHTAALESLKKSKTAMSSRAIKPSTALGAISTALAASVYMPPATTAISDEESKRQRMKQIEAELRENAWKGRAGGLDQSSSVLSIENLNEKSSSISDINRDPKSRRNLRTSGPSSISKNDSSFLLPPLHDLEAPSSIDKHRILHTAAPTRSEYHGSPSRPYTHAGYEVDNANDHAAGGDKTTATEAYVKSMLIKVKKSQKIRSSKTSETEKRLLTR
jgi:hypothetical protein